ncbi:MAG: signal peptidase II [Helicobacter sp.]|nr:signal peptidase II [Helicobacter sp.]
MKEIRRAAAIAIVVFIIDQVIKYWATTTNVFIESNPISLVLAYNTGVAFSMLASFEGSLKYFQILLMVGIVFYLYKNTALFRAHFIPIALFLGAAISNICDRFTYGAVVDYIFWHYGFEFAIFNFADAVINCAVALLLFESFVLKKTPTDVK